MAGVSCSGSTVKETSFTSGMAPEACCTCRIRELMRGQGPVQVVKMKSATQTFPSSDFLSNGRPVSSVSAKPGICP